jgi:hypothetical protein
MVAIATVARLAGGIGNEVVSGRKILLPLQPLLRWSFAMTTDLCRRQ